MRWQRLFIALVVCVSASALPARQGSVTTRDGRHIEGDITDLGPEGVRIATKGGTLTLSRTEVASILYADSIPELYQKRLAALPKNATSEDHYKLAQWLYDLKAYELARIEANTALDLNPNSAEAGLLRRLIDRAMAAERAKQAGPATAPATAAKAAPPMPPAPSRGPRLLTADEINLIRQGEMGPADTSLRVRFEGDVQKRFVEHVAADPREFASRPDFARARDILARGTDQMRKDVRILSDPARVAEFRMRILPMVLTGCASLECHGGAQGGNFQLVNPASTDDAVYTNFYILTHYAHTVGDRRRRLIERAYPEQSLLAEYGLPRDIAEFDHPEVAGWNNLFRSTTDPRFVMLMRWIRDSLGAQEPRYELNYPLGGDTPATRPATPLAGPPGPAPPTTPETAVRRPPEEQPRNPGDPPPRSGEAGDPMDEIRSRLRTIRGF